MRTLAGILAITLLGCRAPEPTAPEPPEFDHDAERMGKLLVRCKGGDNDACSSLGLARKASTASSSTGGAEDFSALPKPPTGAPDRSTAAPAPEPASRPRQPPPRQPPPRPSLADAKADCKSGVILGCWEAATQTKVAMVADGSNETAIDLAMLPYMKRACGLGEAVACKFIPVSSGFFCIDGQTPGTESVTQFASHGWCTRALAYCESMQRLLTSEGWTLKDCERHQRAACYAYDDPLAADHIELCYPSFEVCEAWRSGDVDRARTSADVTGLTKCRTRK